MGKQRESPANLTDEEVLAEFVRRFECDAACLVYFDQKEGAMNVFYRWRNHIGKQFCKGWKDQFNEWSFRPIWNAPDMEGGETVEHSKK